MNTLLVTTQIAGILLLLGTMVLLFYRRIYLDAETKEPIKFTLPVIGEISTQAPVLVLIFVGACLVAYPLSKMGADKATLQGVIDTGGKPVTVLVVAEPDYAFPQEQSGPFSVKIPLLATDATYRIMFVVDKTIIADQGGPLKDGNITLTPVQWAPQEEDPMPLKKEVSDEVLRKLSFVN